MILSKTRKIQLRSAVIFRKHVELLRNQEGLIFFIRSLGQRVSLLKSQSERCQLLKRGMLNLWQTLKKIWFCEWIDIQWSFFRQKKLTIQLCLLNGHWWCVDSTIATIVCREWLLRSEFRKKLTLLPRHLLKYWKMRWISAISRLQREYNRYLNARLGNFIF